MKEILIIGLISMCFGFGPKAQGSRPAAVLNYSPDVLEQSEDTQRPNIVFILSDDHRYDFMGFTGKVPGLETPHMDRMATQGIHCQNAFVNTALCSPSRASILTGQFSHVHEVVDNDAPARDDLIFFPAYLQEAGYKTAFMGKWHMGHYRADPRPGFDHWVSFEGQGVYYNPSLNVDGEEVEYTDDEYITDVLTEYATNWIDEQAQSDSPFFLYLSHKAVHAEFMPARRHQGQYAEVEITYPPTMFPPDVDLQNYRSVTAPQPSLDEMRRAISVNYRYALVPEWVKRQRNSWHGVDYMYNGQMTFDAFYRNYLETLLGIDESIGTVLSKLEEEGLLENTIVVYMGDNGFSFGEHGLIDKRHAYEESMRVPLLVYAPGMLRAQPLTDMVTNVDIAPTFLEVAGLPKPDQMNGQSFLPLLQGRPTANWRTHFFYEYYWERPFPQTPTVHAIRSDRYKFIRYHGIWDINEFYDLEADPYEAVNLIDHPDHQETIRAMNEQLFLWLEETQGLKIPLKPALRVRGGQDWRYGHTY
ncbi:MAG: sulfatase [Bacteroidota bacterium]